MRRFKPLLLALLTIPLAGTLSAADRFEVDQSVRGELDVLRGGKRVARYMHGLDKSSDEALHRTYKPYLHVYDASGTRPITKGPGGQFTHHRGIFLGYSKVGHAGQTFDLWHMKDVQQVHEKFEDQSADESGASVTSVVAWNNKGGVPILRERRQFLFATPSEGWYASIDMNSTLAPTGEDVNLNGDPEHAGAQFRPADEVDRKKTVYFFPGEGTDPHKQPDLAWVGEQYELEGQTYSVVIFNHPENPEGTIFSAYRDYGRFGAFPAFTIKRGETATLKYRWLITEGKMPPVERIQAAYNAYTGKSDPVPALTVRPVSGN
jgi:hypothetical protein